MREFLRQFAAEWNGDRNQRTKLQRAYITIAVLLSTVAGMLVLGSTDVSRALTDAFCRRYSGRVHCKCRHVAAS